ncbi:unnamed protein product, partial [Polarella glacialis]
SDELGLTALDPEEFVSRMESVEDALVIGTNTGRVVELKGVGKAFGPYVAPPGFHISGLRCKPFDEQEVVDSCRDFVSGFDLAPLPEAGHYDAPSALLFAAENEFLQSLREILAKAELDLNAFGAGGATPLMLAASAGGVGSIRMLISSK